MRYHYPFLLTGLGLLLSLTACAPTDTTSESRTGPSNPPVALADAAAPNPNPNTGRQPRPNAAADNRPDEPDAASPRRNTVLAPATPPLGEQAPASSQPTRRQLARLRRQLRRLPTALSSPPLSADTARTAARPASPLPAGTAAATTPPDDAPKKAQVFLIRPDRDTVLYGTEGTVMRIPAGTFVQGGSPDAEVKEPIEIRLREFYSMADILLERLSTMAGPKLLETGGMVQLSAATADGRECKLKPGSDFELGFPATRSIEGMQLYDGQSTNGHGLNWKLAPQRNQR